jgi:hypothetical protein
VGAEAVHYLVVVPERVSVRILLPGGRRLSLSPLASSGTWNWGTAAASDAATARTTPAPGAAGTTAAPVLLPEAAGGEEAGADGFFVAHRDRWAPAIVDLPDLAAVRSLSVRFDGGEFRVAASRPLAVMPGSRSHMELRLDGDPLDVVIYVPRGRADFVLRSGTQTLARSAGDQPATLCSNVVILTPSAEQSWFTFYPQAGRLECR